MKNIAEILAHCAPGKAFYCVFHPPGQEPSVDFVIREKSAVIAGFPQNPPVSLRPALIEVGGVAAVVVMFRIAYDPDRTYETWWNYYRETAESPFEIMAEQGQINFHFYGDSVERERVISVIADHEINSFFGRVIEHIHGMTGWSAIEFELARNAIYRRYGSLDALWDALFMHLRGN
ncbi:MAG: hypothetical protein K8I29_20075 [Alphaproteobacteria bacterium]|uniref:Uncharacterized protein n=1 Tax=Candidatus Nitrobium versatile TaxID=2884831 RepID=A0A953SE28_9BACT|nr:hypothetical protein [Candidatus Nitrobium versatile]